MSLTKTPPGSISILALSMQYKFVLSFWLRPHGNILQVYGITSLHFTGHGCQRRSQKPTQSSNSLTGCWVYFRRDFKFNIYRIFISWMVSFRLGWYPKSNQFPARLKIHFDLFRATSQPNNDVRFVAFLSLQRPTPCRWLRLLYTVWCS